MEEDSITSTIAPAAIERLSPTCHRACVRALFQKSSSFAIRPVRRKQSDGVTRAFLLRIPKPNRRSLDAAIDVINTQHSMFRRFRGNDLSMGLKLNAFVRGRPPPALFPGVR